MANLVSMKLTEEERKAMRDSMLAAPSYEGEQYPWGLALNLDGPSMKKLGLKTMAVGQELTLVAKVKVTSASSYAREGQADETSATLQITEMGLDLPSGGVNDLYSEG